MQNREPTTFQFHKGAIRTMPSTRYIWDANSFQFHKGAIRTQFDGVMQSLHQYFNSIKVRLEPVEDHTLYLQLALFQFHKGAIRTLIRRRTYRLPCAFQFHKGAIRTMKLPDSCRELFHFNSIKVRLEPTVQNQFRFDRIFQFHKGAIRTRYLRER